MRPCRVAHLFFISNVVLAQQNAGTISLEERLKKELALVKSEHRGWHTPNELKTDGTKYNIKFKDHMLRGPEMQKDGRIKKTVGAAVCISGQARTLLETYKSIQAFRDVVPGGANVFMYIGLSDTYDLFKPSVAAFHKFERDHTGAELTPAITALAPVRIQFYNSTSFDRDRNAPRKPGKCFNAPGEQGCCHFSYHGPQFWNVNKCLTMVKDYETQTGVQHRWAVRMRPDARFQGPSQIANIMRSIQADEVPRVWMRGNGGADMFAVMTHSAMEAYRTVWDEFTGDCLTLPGKEKREKDCWPYVHYWTSTECLIVAHLHRTGVDIVGSETYTVSVVRPKG
jgi:hypothetical protein